MEGTGRRVVEIIPLRTIPDIVPGTDLGKVIVEACARENIEIQDRDIIVVASKIVSKAEGRIVKLDNVSPSNDAQKLSEETGLDPRLVELILREGKVLKIKKGLIITLVRSIVCGNAGIDFSNVDGSGETVCLLPEDPDRSARKIRERIRELTGRDVAVLIVDTCGRPFRRGVVNFVIGLAGINPFRSYIGKRDRYGYTMTKTVVCIADEVAAAAELVMGQGDESCPVAIVRGVEYSPCEDCSAYDIYMPEEQWLFR